MLRLLRIPGWGKEFRVEKEEINRSENFRIDQDVNKKIENLRIDQDVNKKIRTSLRIPLSLEIP